LIAILIVGEVCKYGKCAIENKLLNAKAYLLIFIYYIIEMKPFFLSLYDSKFNDLYLDKYKKKNSIL